MDTHMDTPMEEAAQAPVENYQGYYSVVVMLWGYSRYTSLEQLEAVLRDPATDVRAMAIGLLSAVDWPGAADDIDTAFAPGGEMDIEGYIHGNAGDQWDGDEDDYDEESDEDESFDFEDWSAPETGAGDAEEDYEGEIPANTECPVCGRQQVSVQFGSCIHAACVGCVKGIYRSRRRGPEHFPEYIPCPICRAEVRKVGGLSLESDVVGPAVMHGDIEFKLGQWMGLREWMGERSETVKRWLEAEAARISDSDSDGNPGIYAEGRLGNS